MSNFIREPCLCCECKYWHSYVLDYNNMGLGTLNWGRCIKEKPSFPDMFKCEEFEEVRGIG